MVHHPLHNFSPEVGGGGGGVGAYMVMGAYKVLYSTCTHMIEVREGVAGERGLDLAIFQQVHSTGKKLFVLIPPRCSRPQHGCAHFLQRLRYPLGVKPSGNSCTISAHATLDDYRSAVTVIL